MGVEDEGVQEDQKTAQNMLQLSLNKEITALQEASASRVDAGAAAGGMAAGMPGNMMMMNPGMMGMGPGMMAMNPGMMAMNPGMMGMMAMNPAMMGMMMMPAMGAMNPAMNPAMMGGGMMNPSMLGAGPVIADTSSARAGSSVAASGLSSGISTGGVEGTSGQDLEEVEDEGVQEDQYLNSRRPLC